MLDMLFGVKASCYYHDVATTSLIAYLNVAKCQGFEPYAAGLYWALGNRFVITFCKAGITSISSLHTFALD